MLRPPFLPLLALVFAAPLLAQRPADEPQEIALDVGELFVPPQTSLAGRPVLHVHLHGSPRFVRERTLVERGRAVLLAVHRNGFSSVYAKYAVEEGRLPNVLARVEEALRAREPRFERVGRLVVTAFSAGYGAVRAWLATEEGRARIDAVGLADGLHAGYESAGRPRADQMEPFVAFARLAAAGRRVFRFTHSAIVPPGYASTTECADALLSALALRREVLGADEGTCVPRTRARRGGFAVFGWAGDEAADHVFHVRLLFEHLDALGVPVAPLRVGVVGTRVSEASALARGLGGEGAFAWRALDPADLANGALASCDVVLLASALDADAFQPAAREALRGFVRAGGGCVALGPAAGLVATSDEPGALALVDARVRVRDVPPDARTAFVLGEEGARVLRLAARRWGRRASRQAVLEPAGRADLEDVRALVELAPPAVGETAGDEGAVVVAAAAHGKGRVLVATLHHAEDELSPPGLHAALHWAAGR